MTGAFEIVRMQKKESNREQEKVFVKYRSENTAVKNDQ